MRPRPERDAPAAPCVGGGGQGGAVVVCWPLGSYLRLQGSLLLHQMLLRGPELGASDWSFNSCPIDLTSWGRTSSAGSAFIRHSGFPPGGWCQALDNRTGFALTRCSPHVSPRPGGRERVGLALSFHEWLNTPPSPTRMRALEGVVLSSKEYC